jgi:uncharacterized protein (TIGR02246 family)
MKKLSFALAILFASLIFAQDADVRSKIQQYNDKMEQAILQNEFETLYAMYADDAISLPSYAPILRGKEEIRESMQRDIERGTKVTKVEFNTTEVRQEGDVVIEVGTYDMSFTMKDSDQSIDDTGKYITVWEKDGNDWKVAMEMWNTDKNPWEDMNKDQQKQDKNE